MGVTHFLNPEKVHYRWDNSRHPALQVKPGDTVVFELQDVSAGQITPRSTDEDLTRIDLGRIYPLGGPIYVEDAKPGDVLEVEVAELRTKGWGWTGIIPGLGLLSEEFEAPYLKIWDLSPLDHVWFKEGITIPLEPFCGVMGVTPPEKGSFDVMPPGKFGGNMDIRHLIAGSKLYLPVWVDGALFSCGDCHAAQGDGEVCVTGIEAPMTVTLRFNVLKGRAIPEPQFMVPGPLTRKYDERGYYATSGISPDLMEAAKKAVRHMINHLSAHYGLSREEAYMLCSVAVDLKISQVVDKPNWTVSAYLPLRIFNPP